jgi:fructose-bisphosphate aldolase class II
MPIIRTASPVRWKATKAGFDSVVFDLSALPFDQTIRQTKEAIEVLKGINPALVRD